MYFFQQLFQLIQFVILDEYMLVVNIFDDELVAVVVVDAVDDGLDGRVAFDKNTYGER